MPNLTIQVLNFKLQHGVKKFSMNKIIYIEKVLNKMNLFETISDIKIFFFI
jgi:hypothetical protein